MAEAYTVIALSQIKMKDLAAASPGPAEGEGSLVLHSEVDGERGHQQDRKVSLVHCLVSSQDRFATFQAVPPAAVLPSRAA
jgi:hypothetical protein